MLVTHPSDTLIFLLNAITIFHFFQDDDDDDFSGPAIGGPVGVRSDSDEEYDDDDAPPMMGKMRSQMLSNTINSHSTASNKKPFSMEVIDF